MKLWISRFFLMIGLVLLLFHNIVAHHHDDEHDERIHHHDLVALEHVKIDHIFSAQCYYFDGLQAIIPNLVFRPEYSFVNFPVILPVQPVILPDEPYPPGWITDQTILRGPPCKVNQLFS
jgi:hypothetical protein